MRYLVVILTSFIMVSDAYAAICPCDAPPSCGSSRPSHCHIDDGKAKSDDDKHKFYANKSVQNLYKEAFALSSESKNFVNTVYASTFEQADKFINDLKKDEILWKKVLNYGTLSIAEQIAVLAEVFNIEVKSLGIVAPEISISTNYERAAYFEYDLQKKGNGTVYINPKKTYDENRLMSLSLLIHETRHASQLALAKNSSKEVMGASYKAAFTMQKNMKGKLNFSDFLTLNNEYEAFLFANYVFHKIYNGQEDMIDMGTYASQFRQDGSVKIDLKNLHAIHPHLVLEMFNMFMAEQAQDLGVK